MEHATRRSATAGFTLLEMLITIFLLGVLAGMVSLVAVHSRAKARAMKCLSNQKSISRAMLGYYTDKGTFPLDGNGCALAEQLSDYLPWPESKRSMSLPEVWRCPNDRADALTNSYESYYVNRREAAGNSFFVLGCPRHEDAGHACINMNGLDDGYTAVAGRINANGATVAAEASPTERTIASGEMTFEDGSQVRVTEPGADFGVTAVSSFRHDDGRLYTIVRVNGTGKAEFSVTPGSKFEVVTPVAIIGVRGTTFSVDNQPAWTKVALHTGSLEVEDRHSSQVHNLEPGDTCEIGLEDTDEPLELKCISNHCWKVKNPNAFDVSFCWEILPNGYWGWNKVRADSSLTFYVSTFSKPQSSMHIWYSLPNLGDQYVSASVDD